MPKTEILSIRVDAGTKAELQRVARERATNEDREVSYRELVRAALEDVLAGRRCKAR